jgi:flagellar hook-associated protein 2
MPTITSSGVGSGLDINSLVSQLVAAERSAPERRMSREDARLTTEFTALASLKGAMSTFQSALTALKTAGSLDLRKAIVGDETAFGASVTSAAAAGSYDVEVTQLATASRLGSAVFAGGPDSVVGTGSLTITSGATSFSIDIDAESDSLAQIRDAINAAPDNAGVRATLIRDTNGTGSYLVLTGAATGAANAVSVSATGADAGLTQLVADLQSADPLRDVVAQDAIVFVSGYEIHSASNTVTGAIDGVTLNLKAAEVGTTVSLTVERDDSAIQKKVETFVNAYNVLAQQITSLSRYDAATKTAAPLLGDAMLRGMESQIRRVLSEPVAGATGGFNSLASLGITTTASGTLRLDASKLTAALAEDSGSVARIFTSEAGVAVRLSQYMDDRLASNGEMATRDAGIASRRKALEKQADALDARMVVVEARYMKQFSALDSMLAQMQSTSSYLTQQLAGLSNLNKS